MDRTTKVMKGDTADGRGGEHFGLGGGGKGLDLVLTGFLDMVFSFYIFPMR